MKEREWTEYRLSKECGLSESTLANIFRRNTVPSITTLETICDAFGITLSQFFLEDDEKNIVLLNSKQLLLLKSAAKLNAEQYDALLTFLQKL